MNPTLLWGLNDYEATLELKRIIFILLLLTLTACGTSQLAEATAPPPTKITTPPPVQPVPTATVRIVMIATDPATFVLEADQPQLVDFFAFW